LRSSIRWSVLAVTVLLVSSLPAVGWADHATREATDNITARGHSPYVHTNTAFSRRQDAWTRHGLSPRCVPCSPAGQTRFLLRERTQTGTGLMGGNPESARMTSLTQPRLASSTDLTDM